jgi:hypothetical protein
MRPTGIWRWYTDITITQQSGQYPSSCLLLKTRPKIIGILYLIGSTLRFRYKPNGLMLSVGFVMMAY